MTQTESIREKLDEVGGQQRNEFHSSGWWHSIDLGDGRITPGVHKLEELCDNYARFDLPEDLRGKRLLDIGAWDGFYSFEAERRGAQVVSADVWRPETYFEARRALHSSAEHHEMSVYELSRDRMGDHHRLCEYSANLPAPAAFACDVALPRGSGRPASRANLRGHRALLGG